MGATRAVDTLSASGEFVAEGLPVGPGPIGVDVAVASPLLKHPGMRLDRLDRLGLGDDSRDLGLIERLSLGRLGLDQPFDERGMEDADISFIYIHIMTN